MEKPDSDKVFHAEWWQVVSSVVGISVGVVVFTFATFSTKAEVEARAKSDEKVLEIMQRDLIEIKQDVKDLIKNSKR